MKNWSWIVMRDVSSYEKSLCFVEVWMGAGKKKWGVKEHCAGWDVLLEGWPLVCMSPGSSFWAVITHQLSGCGCQFLALLFIIIYVFSRNITYDHCSKYWSNYVLEIKDFIKLMAIWGEQRFHFRMSSVSRWSDPPVWLHVTNMEASY